MKALRKSPLLRFLPASTSKYRNIKCEMDGFRFDSRREMQRYATLKLRVRIGEIADLKLQVAFPLIVNGTKVGKYVADFRYRVVASGEVVVEDVKSKPTMTAVYRLKKKLMLACHEVRIFEVL